MKRMFVPLARPDITEKEIEAVTEVMKSGILSIGGQIQEFERLVAEYTGRSFGIAVNSGTSALHLLMKAVDLRRHDFLLTSPFTFVSSANVAIYEGAIPVFADIDEKTLNVGPENLEEALERYEKSGIRTGKLSFSSFRPSVFMGVDIFGHPLEWEAIGSICDRYGVKIIEDSCEALGSEYKNRKTGTFGLAGTFAFYPNKQITPGEGGVIVTDDERIANLSRRMKTQGRGCSGSWLEHVRLGYNYRMDELAAAMGVVQMNRLDAILASRNTVARLYDSLFEEIPDIETPYVADYVTSMGWFVYVVKLPEKVDKAKVMAYLREQGVQCREYFRPLHVQPYYMEAFGYGPGMFPVTERISKRTLAIPFFNKITAEQQEYVVHVLRKALEIAG